MADKVRRDYEREVLKLADLSNLLKVYGFSDKTVAKILWSARRRLGIKYKDIRNTAYRERIYLRNIRKYGDKLGPTWEYLVGIKSYKEIIESSYRPNAGYDALSMKYNFTEG